MATTKKSSEKKSTMIRASEKARLVLKRFSEQEGRSQVELLDEAMEVWEKQRLLLEMRRGYEALYADPKKTKAYEAETSLYQNADADGLED